MLPSLLINSDRGAHEPEWALSALLAAMEIGNNSARIADAIAVSSAFPQVHGTPASGCLERTALKPAETCCSVAPMPVSWSTTYSSKARSPSDCTFLAPRFQPVLRMPTIQASISSIRNLCSSMGSEPSLPTGLPSISVEPETSTTWIRASQRAKSERNWLPLPLPSCAPGTSPATSTRVTGTSRR